MIPVTYGSTSESGSTAIFAATLTAVHRAAITTTATVSGSSDDAHTVGAGPVIAVDIRYCVDGVQELGVPPSRLRFAGAPVDPQPLLSALQELCASLANLTPNTR